MPTICSDKCLDCGKNLLTGHKNDYCASCLTKRRRAEKIQKWLETGDTGMGVDTTIRGAIRDYILEEQDHLCAICDWPDDWNGKPLNFILDHIDGDASNSKRENLRLICPNCDSQLPTYKSRNKNSARNLRKTYLQENYSK